VKDTYLEASIEKIFNKLVKTKVGGKTIKLWAFNNVGIPDRIVLIPGARVAFVELKTKVGKLKPIQAYFHNQLRGLGFPVAVLYGKAEVEEWIRALESQALSEQSAAKLSRQRFFSALDGDGSGQDISSRNSLL